MTANEWITNRIQPKVCPCCGAKQPLHSAIAYCDDCNNDTCGHWDDPPTEAEALEEEEEYEDDTLGPCGCTDYHMADCAVISSDPNVHDTGMTKEDWLSIEGDWWDD